MAKITLKKPKAGTRSKITTAITKFIPENVLALTKAKLKEVIVRSNTDDVHSVYVKMYTYLDNYYSVAYDELLKRLKEHHKKTGMKTLQTEAGSLQLVEKTNYDFDEKKIIAYCKKKNIPLEDVFNVKYELVTNDKRVINNLLAKGHAIQKLSLTRGKFADVAEEHTTLLNYVKELPSEFSIRGL